MRLVFLAASGALALAGCGVRHDIEFARGCWAEHVSPGGPVVAMLRLLPDREGRETYSGVLSRYLEGAPQGQPIEYTLALDGSVLETRPVDPDAPADAKRAPADRFNASKPPALASEQAAPGEMIAAFLSTQGKGWTVLAGGGDHLAIYTVLGDGGMGSTLFYGERDGCD
jgi:hypothetical protein